MIITLDRNLRVKGYPLSSTLSGFALCSTTPQRKSCTPKFFDDDHHPDQTAQSYNSTVGCTIIILSKRIDTKVSQIFYMRRLDKRIHKTNITFWAVLGSWGCRESHARQSSSMMIIIPTRLHRATTAQ